MSNGQQDDSVHFKEEDTESRAGTGACTLVTVLESKKVVIMTQRVHWKQRQKWGWKWKWRWRQRLFFYQNSLFCKEDEGLCFSVGGCQGNSP
jgi:hypothetical protein